MPFSACRYTRLIRYHRRDYVRDFAAEAVSFLFRNAPLKQVIKGESYVRSTSGVGLAFAVFS